MVPIFPDWQNSLTFPVFHFPVCFNVLFFLKLKAIESIPAEQNEKSTAIEFIDEK